MIADAPQIDVPAAISCASLGSTPRNFPMQTVKVNVASTVAAMMPRPRLPISMTWLEVNWSPRMIDRISGLKVVIPGSILMANDAPVTIEVSNRPGRISRVLRPDHRRVTEGRGTPAFPFSNSAGLLVEIRVTSWLRFRFPTQYRGPQFINPTNYECEINRFY